MSFEATGAKRSNLGRHLDFGVETMTVPSSTSVSSPLGEVQGSDGEDVPDCISSLALSFVEEYAAACNSAITPSVAELKNFSEVLRDATRLARSGKASKLTSLCFFLPAAIKRTIRKCDLARALNSETEFQAYVFEVLHVLVELVVATFSSEVGDLAIQAITIGPNISQLLVALCHALSSESKFYKWRRENGMREVVVCSWRLESVLQVPGVFVKVSGRHIDGQVHYFCSQKGVNQSGEACACCELPKWADPVLASLTSLIAKAASGGGYELVLRMLCNPFNAVERFSLPTIALLLRSLSQLLRNDTGSNSWRKVIPQMQTNSKIEFKDLCREACSKLFQSLDEMVPVEHVDPCPSLNVVGTYHEAFSVIITHLHTVTSWVVEHYGGNSELIHIRDSLGKLQERTWERFLHGRVGWVMEACFSIGAAIEATLTPTRRQESLFSLKWLEEKNIIFQLLDFDFREDELPKVKDFLAILAKKGVVLREKVFLALISSCDCSIDVEYCNSPDLVGAAVLDELDTSTYSAGFLERVLEWLESRQANSVINGSRIFFILSKLLTNDKERTWEKRFLTLMKKHSAGVLERDLMDCLSMVADHYSSPYGIGPVKDTCLWSSDEQAKLLQACSSADMASCISTDMDVVLNDSKIYFENKAEIWKSQEMDLYTTTSFELAKSLAIDFPMTRHETAKKCLHRVVLAKNLASDSNANDSDTSLASCVMTEAMSAELQTLEALKNESFGHCNVVRQVEELGRKHAKGYHALMQEQQVRLAEYLEACRKEKEDVIWESLYQKAKVLAGMKRASVRPDEDLSAEDILKRLLQKTQGALKEVTAKHREGLERLPNINCTVCFTEFSKKRKRACLEPCGHANACIDCTTREWKRTNTCPMCKADIEKPIPIPSKLYF